MDAASSKGYGPPCSYEELLGLIRFCGSHRFNTWVHAPKDDLYHQQRWRDPYPADELQCLGELVEEARRNEVEFVYAVAPGLDICYTREDEFEALPAKCEQLKGIGVRSFQLLWDDIEHALHCPEDERLFGHEPRPSAAAQASLTNRFARELAQPGPLVMCPMGYVGTEDTRYRRILGARLDPDVVVYWTRPACCGSPISYMGTSAARRFACGSYNIDIREMERTWRYLPEYEPVPSVLDEGYVAVPVPPYPIPLRSLLPRRDDCERLLVPVCLSASHVAFGSIRMEPMLLLSGAAAGGRCAGRRRRLRRPGRRGRGVVAQSRRRRAGAYAVIQVDGLRCRRRRPGSQRRAGSRPTRACPR